MSIVSQLWCKTRNYKAHCTEAKAKKLTIHSCYFFSRETATDESLHVFVSRDSTFISNNMMSNNAKTTK